MRKGTIVDKRCKEIVNYVTRLIRSQSISPYPTIQKKYNLDGENPDPRFGTICEKFFYKTLLKIMEKIKNPGKRVVLSYFDPKEPKTLREITKVLVDDELVEGSTISPARIGQIKDSTLNKLSQYFEQNLRTLYDDIDPEINKKMREFDPD